jgi:hypothetical protein
MDNQSKKIQNNTDPDNIKYIKICIVKFFSEELQQDKSLGGSMERKQLKKWLLSWANKNE